MLDKKYPDSNMLTILFNQKDGPKGFPDAEMKKKNHFIFEELKRSIMEGKYKPREPLNERDLASSFGVSRSPVREAIRKLEGLGMVKILPNRGARVADFSAAEIEALYFVRHHLELIALKLILDSVSSGEIRTLSEINQKVTAALGKGDYAKVVEENYRFHNMLSSLSRNSFLMKMVEDVRARCFPCSYYFWRHKKYAQYAVKEHNGIIKALRNRDYPKLKDITERHLHRSKNIYLQYLAEAEKVRAY